MQHGLRDAQCRIDFNKQIYEKDNKNNNSNLSGIWYV